ncbi:MAG: BNR repeat-containing protein [Sedimentisphaerales bacterium]|nr:BNR repeat-containing protein [Sedimentisphaerales bacterium]
MNKFMVFILSSMFLLSVAYQADAESPKRLQIVDSLEIEQVESSFPVGFTLMTQGKRQYVAYYDANHQMTVAYREVESRKWEYKRLDEKIGWDSHNRVTMVADNKGYLHVSGNMHCVPLVYFRSKRPWDIASLERVVSMVGKQEQRVTYPNFMLGPNNELIYHYRDGSSGSGSEIYNVFDSDSMSWKRLLDTPLIDGEKKMNAYMTGPSKGPDGWFHLGWVWRDTPDCKTNHDPSYARSCDLIHWETVEGKRVELPIYFETAGLLIDAVPPGGGIINGSLGIGFDSSKNVVATYHKFDENGNTQVYAGRFANGRWNINQVTDWDYRWDFQGGGSIISEIGLGTISPHEKGKLAMSYRHDKYGSGLLVLDEKSLKLTGTEKKQSLYPPGIVKPESNFEGMKVKIETDSGDDGDPASRYILRWETLPPNRDRARTGALPKPTTLRLIKLQ